MTPNPELMAKEAKEGNTPRQPTLTFVSEVQRGHETQSPKATRSRYLAQGDGIESQVNGPTGFIMDTRAVATPAPEVVSE